MSGLLAPSEGIPFCFLPQVRTTEACVTILRRAVAAVGEWREFGLTALCSGRARGKARQTLSIGGLGRVEAETQASR